ncbi:MAG: LicD family protein [Clostridiales bacterium]|nr:LicD family protein [Clostridiales bacterium]
MYEMNRDIYNDEIIVTCQSFTTYRNVRLKKAKKDSVPDPRAYKKFVVISDGTAIEDVLVPALSMHVSAIDGGAVYFVDAFDDSVYAEPFRSEKHDIAERLALSDLDRIHFSETAFILLADTKKKDEKWFDILDKATSAASKDESNIVVFSELVPFVRKLPAEVTGLSEREYDFVIEKMTEDKTPEEEFLIKLGKRCRSIVRCGYKRLTVLRFDNIYGSTNSNSPAFDFDTISADAFKNGSVKVTKEENLFRFSCIYSVNAALCVFAAAENAKFGHEYNVSNSEVSIANVKRAITDKFPDKVALTTDGKTYSPDDSEYHRLATLKFFHEMPGLKKMFKPFSDSFERVLCHKSGNAFVPASKLTVYQGKLRRLKEAEIDILTEIDRICRRHHIKYFLTGGSLLGAVRNNKSIPWDDDLDIGMLRDDFEVFRRVAPKEINTEKYVYSSPQTDKNCHYYFDKIRLRDTYFSTFYSGKFKLDDGVFVDVVVYDKTTENQFMQKAQIKFTSYSISSIYVRWHDHPVSNPRLKKASKVLLPFMRMFPFDTYHNVYDYIKTFYNNKDDAKYLLDGGAHLINGGFDITDLDCPTKDVDFDGIKAPIPVNYDAFLRFVYGDGYFAEPNLSAQLGAHLIARLDLGKYLLSNDPELPFRSVNINGELFEDEKES